jgi:alkaline phosphatase
MSNKLLLKRISVLFIFYGLFVSGFAQSSRNNFPTKREETPQTWKRDGYERIQKARSLNFKRKKAKNVILFIGDGMGISTLTAARILEGQMRGESGEENFLSFELFPFLALSKTYSVNQQTSDSAPTAAAIMTGVKTDEGVLSVDQNVVRGDYKSVRGNEAKTLLEMAEENGLSTGVVTTARLTHATPASAYAHTPSRDWESDADIFRQSKEAHEAGFPDIARQLIEFPYGNGLEVALGGGRLDFLPKEMKDPEYPDDERAVGRRLDKRNLTAEWTSKNKNAAYIWNKKQFDEIDAKKTDHLLGLFQTSHMNFEVDRQKDPAGEPSLSEMTAKAIDILSKNKKGYFLMVEAGKIDHGHHNGNAYRALTETIELSNAVRTAKNKVKTDDTLIIVTADHSHVMTFAGYPARGNNILGLVRELDDTGDIEKDPALDVNKKPYTTLGYANGTGHVAGERPDLTQETVTNPDYKQEATIPKTGETHGGEDVAIYADGVNAWMIHGLMEQNWIFYVMQDALRLNEKK